MSTVFRVEADQRKLACDSDPGCDDAAQLGATWNVTSFSLLATYCAGTDFGDVTVRRAAEGDLDGD